MSDNGNILLVEDEENLGATLNEYLISIGHKSTWVKTVAKAKEAFQVNNPNIILMDIGLPDGDGIQLAKEFRDRRKDFVLLFLSALNAPETKLEALEIGADDYITKPFALKELTLRLEKIIKYNNLNIKKSYLEYGKLKIWFDRYEVEDGNGNIIPLSQKECNILRLLFENKNNAVSRDKIIEQVWGVGQFPSNRTVDNYIVRLRRWCESDSTTPVQITSIRGVGYKLTVSQ